MSMLRPAVNQLISPDESVYSLVVGIAKRAREISDEYVVSEKEKDKDKEKEKEIEKIKPQEILDENPVKLAVEEFANKKFKIYTEPVNK